MLTGFRGRSISHSRGTTLSFATSCRFNPALSGGQQPGTPWEILTEVDGKAYGGIIKRGNEGIVITTSLPMALRLAQAAHRGDREAYKHALMYLWASR